MIIEIFNRYRACGGEELIANQILHAIRKDRPIQSLRWHSSDWDRPEAPSKLGQLRRLFDNPDSAEELEDIINQGNVECLLCHNIYPIGSPSIYRVAREKKIPVIQFTHNFRPYSVSGTLWTGKDIAPEGLFGDFRKEIRTGAWQNSSFKSLLFALMLKWQKYRGYNDVVTHWIAISNFMRDAFIQAGTPPERITTLKHFWVPIEQLPEPSDQGYYLFLGRLAPEKGIQVLLATWAALEQRLGNQCPRLIIGGTGDLQHAVAAASQANLKIQYVGYVSGEYKNELIANCRAMLAPSIWWEPLGLVTYEAYDFAKPMLAAASGGLTETVTDSVTGFLHTPGSVNSFIESIIRCEGLSEQQRIQMGNAGRQWLLEDANLESWRHHFNQILQDVCK